MNSFIMPVLSFIAPIHGHGEIVHDMECKCSAIGRLGAVPARLLDQFGEKCPGRSVLHGLSARQARSVGAASLPELFDLRRPETLTGSAIVAKLGQRHDQLKTNTSAMFMLVRIANKTISRAGLSTAITATAWSKLGRGPPYKHLGQTHQRGRLSPALQRNRFLRE